MSDYLDLNRASWDDRAPVHAASRFYGLDRFDEPTHISEVVAYDRTLLGDISGLDGVHLQCHIGSDTISLSRLGARMSGLDFSGVSVREARALAKRAGADVRFVESDVYEAVAALGGQTYDLVYTGIGALCWLPSIDGWAQVVADLLRPGGRLFIREGHPVLWSLDETVTESLVIGYPYVERAEPMVFDGDVTYTDADRPLAATVTHEWNHGLGEIVTALLRRGLVLTGLVEHDSVPWDALPGQMEQIGGGEYRLADRPWRLPHSYTLQACRPA